jgi:hypothetical protein
MGMARKGVKNDEAFGQGSYGERECVEWWGVGVSSRVPEDVSCPVKRSDEWKRTQI